MTNAYNPIHAKLLLDFAETLLQDLKQGAPLELAEQHGLSSEEAHHIIERHFATLERAQVRFAKLYLKRWLKRG